MKTFLLLLTVIYAPALALGAPCGSHDFTPPRNVQLKGDSLLIVTHPSSVWDGRFASKVGMDEAVEFAKKRKIPVVYLEGNDQHQTYFFADCKPDYWVASGGGEFNFAVNANHVYSVGGHWELCQKSTQADLMRMWKDRRDVNLTFTQVLDGLYAYGAYVSSDDPYYEAFRQFMKVVSFRRPGQDQWPKQKLNMLEMMGLIDHPAREIEYLKRNLPPYDDYINSQYRVELWLNGHLVETLRAGRGTRPPTLKLEFVDSLYEDGYPSGVFPSNR